MIELCCEYISVACIWLYAIIMSCTHVRLNLHSLVALKLREFFLWKRGNIWNLIDNNGNRARKYLNCKSTLQHLAKLDEWLSCVVSTYPISCIHYIILSCHVRVLEWIYTLQFPECQRKSCSKQVQHLKF